MSVTFRCATILGLLLCASPAWADDKNIKDDKVADDKDKKDDKVAQELSKIAQLGPGVHAIKKDDKGRIKSCIVVGQSRISTVLGKGKGLEVARQRAQLAAQAEFVKWLKSKVSVHESQQDETTLFMEGSEDNDKDTLKESGKAVEKTGKKIDVVSEGLIRGLQVIHTEVSDKDKTSTVLYGWSKANAEGTKGAKKVNDSDDEAKKPDAKDKKKTDKKVEDKKATSKDAKDFLP